MYVSPSLSGAPEKNACTISETGVPDTVFVPILPIFRQARVRHAYRHFHALRNNAVSPELPKSGARGYIM